MAKKKRKPKTSEDLNTENELIKLKLMAEFGGDFVGGDKVPPDIENQFLKQIMQFHQKHDKSKMTTVYKMIGEPEYNHVHDLNDKEVSRELKRLLRLMDKSGIGLSVLADTPAREVYRFITEELFKHEIEDVKLKGWMTQFIYEEFHPNAEYDVRTAVTYAIQYFFSKDSYFFEEYFSEEMKNSIGLTMELEELEQKVSEFWNRFNGLQLEQVDLPKIEVDKEAGTARVLAKVQYKTQPAKGKRYKNETAQMEFYLEQDKDMPGWWTVNRVVSELF